MTPEKPRHTPSRKSAPSAKSPPPSLAEWRALYAAANQIAFLAPWTWMEETDVFAVADPDTGELGFVSVTGSLGAHLSVTVYRGPRALYQFNEIQMNDDVDLRSAPEAILEIPQLQASFEDRVVLQPRDIDVVKSLDLKYRGARAWPMFRSYVPGYMPWFIDAAEARTLTRVLEQVAHVAPRFRDEPGLIQLDDNEAFLLRAAERYGDVLDWRDSFVRVPPPPPESIAITLSSRVVDALSKLPRDGEPIEADLFLVPATIGEPTKRSPYVYMLLLVGARSGLVLGHEILMAEPSLDVMLGEVAGHVAQNLSVRSSRPKKIRVPSERLFNLLQPLTVRIDVPIEIADKLTALDEARSALEAMFGRGR